MQIGQALLLFLGEARPPRAQSVCPCGYGMCLGIVRPVPHPSAVRLHSMRGNRRGRVATLTRHRLSGVGWAQGDRVERGERWLMVQRTPRVPLPPIHQQLRGEAARLGRGCFRKGKQPTPPNAVRNYSPLNPKRARETRRNASNVRARGGWATENLLAVRFPVRFANSDCSTGSSAIADDFADMTPPSALSCPDKFSDDALARGCDRGRDDRKARL